MRIPRLRSVAIVLAAGIGLGGCATYSPFGYGSGVSIGYGNHGYYDPYYGGYGYRAGYAPYGWYDGFYYPGAGYYVYDRYRNPYYWNDYQRRYWTVRQRDPSVREVWTDFARDHATRSGTSQVQPSSTARVVERQTTSRPERVRASRSERAAARSERASARSERAAARSERRETRVRRSDSE